MAARYKKGMVIKNTCWQCYGSEMTIYRVTRNKSSDCILVWCECECGAVDDLFITE